MDHAFSTGTELSSFYQGLHALEPYLLRSRAFTEDIAYIAPFIEEYMPVSRIVLFRTGEDGGLGDMASWGLSDDEREEFERNRQEASGELLKQLDGKISLDGDNLYEILAPRLPNCPRDMAAFSIVGDGRVLGAAIFTRQDGAFSQDEMNRLSLTTSALGMSLLNKAYIERTSVEGFVFNGFLENLKTNLFITDPKTDEVLFMNRYMKENLDISHPEGKKCYEVLEKNQKCRCDFCQKDALLKDESENPTRTSERESSLDGNIYEHHDALMRWTDGTIVHVQHSVDISDAKPQSLEASMDELTGMLNRRAGKKELEKTLRQAISEKKDFTACMYDVNSLKKVNDTYGHGEGDFLISTIANTVKFHLRPQDYPFRLSGDEFIVIFPGLDAAGAQKIMDRSLESLREKRAVLNKPYDLGFCYGTFECQYAQQLTVSDILRQTDARMYEQKRKFHIQEAVKNMTDRPAYSAELAQSFSYDREKLYGALVRSMDDYLFVCDVGTGVYQYPPQMVEEFALPGEFVENGPAVLSNLVHPDDVDAFMIAHQEVIDGRRNALSCEYRCVNKKGDWVWMRSRGYLVRDKLGESSLFAGIITNLGKKNKIDHTTGLLNKHEFESTVVRLLTDRPEAPLAVMVINLDEFRRVNDLYNREFGDEVIRIVAHKMQTHLPNNAMLYRMDGDEFAVLFRNGSKEELSAFYEKIKADFASQQEYDGKKYFCTASAGAAFYPMDAINYLDLLKYAGYALESAKGRGKDALFFFSMEIMTHKTRELELTEMLRESVERDYRDFSLNFQPQVDAATGQINGAEALLRWTSSKYGPLSPLEFVPLLEKSGLIHPVGRWILREAVKVLKRWIRIQPDFAISVNLSYLQLVHPDFLQFIENTLKENEVPARNIILEVTETNMAANKEALKDVFKKLRALGVRIAMDDFGTGYSSLDILKMSPADIVKIDRVFVKNLQNSAFDATFIKFIVALCHDVNIKVCLEGVESLDEYSIVQPMELDTIQGYLFGRPLTEDEFVQLME